MSTVTWTATGTVGGVYSTAVAAATTTKAHSTSLLSGAGDPTKYNPENPLILVVIQLFVIIAFSRILHLGLAKLRQPRVLSEILAGILLGPTAMGRIPGFSHHIFPTESLPFLNLLATMGLVLFLFVIGLEVDFGLFRSNLRPSLAVSLAGMAVPFGLGCALSVGLYNEFIDKDIKFTNFMIATASSITAFPVLARILTELNLMHDSVGVIVLASGVANDVIGWVLLALSVALSAASQGQVVVYILLCAVGWTLVLWFIIRPIFDWLGKVTGSYDGKGPTQSYICAVLVLVLVSAWVMEEIGISSIFGGFVVGLILPGGLAAEITEKIEDLVLSIFIPLYFATSGLKTNLGLLNSGTIWAWVICIMVVAFCGKFFGCAIAAKSCGFSIRESGAVGSLMAAKGLIELVVLNIGLQAGIINTTVFSCYVLEALVLTFAATPLTLAFYPPHLRRSVEYKADDTVQTTRPSRDEQPDVRSRFTIVLERFENLGPLFVFSRLVATPPSFSPASTATSLDGTLAIEDQVASVEKKLPQRQDAVAFDTLRLVELTDRTSAVMNASNESNTEENLQKDPLSMLYATFASLNGIQISSRSFSVVGQSSFAETVISKAESTESDFVLVPWRLQKPGEESVVASYIPNPFEALFGKPSTEGHSSSYTSFLRDLYASSPCDVGVFLDRGSPPPPDALPGFHHLFLPFHGGADDRACLELVTQLARGNRGISVTVLVITRAPEPTEEDKEAEGMSKMESQAASTTKLKTDDPAPAIQFTIQGGAPLSPRAVGGGETIYPTQHDGIESDTADSLALEQARSRAPPTISFLAISTVSPLRTSLLRASLISKSSQARFTWVLGRGRRDAASHRAEGLEILKQAERERTLGVCASAEVRRCLGEMGTAALISGVGCNLLVVQSRQTGGRRGRGGV